MPTARALRVARELLRFPTHADDKAVVMDGAPGKFRDLSTPVEMTLWGGGSNPSFYATFSFKNSSVRSRASFAATGRNAVGSASRLKACPAPS